MPKVFSFDRRTEFFRDLEMLLDQYPEIKDFLSKANDEHPLDEHFPDDYPRYDPESPVTYTAIALLINVSNMEYHEATMTLTPWAQSAITTIGLISDADDGSDLDGG